MSLTLPMDNGHPGYWYGSAACEAIAELTDTSSQLVAGELALECALQGVHPPAERQALNNMLENHSISRQDFREEVAAILNERGAELVRQTLWDRYPDHFGSSNTLARLTGMGEDAARLREVGLY